VRERLQRSSAGKISLGRLIAELLRYFLTLPD
jgi:hypothetical protein